MRKQVLGEGGYDQSELLIQRLLSEADERRVSETIVPVKGEGAQAEADWRDLRSPETYIGYDKAENFMSPGGIRQDRPVVYRDSGRRR